MSKDMKGAIQYPTKSALYLQMNYDVYFVLSKSKMKQLCDLLGSAEIVTIGYDHEIKEVHEKDSDVVSYRLLDIFPTQVAEHKLTQLLTQDGDQQ